MRRIVIIAASTEGLHTAARIKRRLFAHEVNVVIPTMPEGKPPAQGPVGERRLALLPDLEALGNREVGTLTAHNIMPDLEQKRIILGSDRGSITIGYSDLLLEVSATARLPRALRQCTNVFAWPMTDFAADPTLCDAALASATQTGKPVLVVGDGPDALDAAIMACQAGLRVVWLRTEEQGAPALDAHLAALAIKHLSISAPGQINLRTDQLAFVTNAEHTRLDAVNDCDGTILAEDFACCFWTTPLIAPHPILREPCVSLTPSGSIAAEPDKALACGLTLMGSGVAMPGAVLASSGATMPAWPGGRENAQLSALAAMNAVLGKSGEKPVSFGIRRAGAGDIRFIRAGLTSVEAARQGIESEHVAVSLDYAKIPGNGQSDAKNAILALCLVCDKKSRTLIGVQALGLNVFDAATEGAFGLAFAALSAETPVQTLADRPGAGNLATLVSEAAAALINRLNGTVQGISPDELLASKKAGAEFFTLDLRPAHDWGAGHVPDAYNIPIAQFKKRVIDEVPAFTPLVLISGTGKEAYIVACQLAGIGATSLYVLDGGMRLWPYAEEIADGQAGLV